MARIPIWFGRWQAQFGLIILSATFSYSYFPDSATYHTVDAFSREIRELASKYPDTIVLEDSGRSRNNETLFLLHLTDRKTKSTAEKLKIMITFGEHAREYLPVESFFKLVKDLAASFSSGDAEAKYILEHSELLLVGLVNPDGRRLIEQKRLYCHRGMGNGVDVNRNFDWGYGGAGSSSDPNNEEYRGPHAFSEPESRFVQSIARAHKVDAYMSMHTGARFIFVPYRERGGSDSESKRLKRRPPNTRDQLSLASVMWAAADGFFTGEGVVYEENDYVADGTIGDWMSAVMKVPYSLTFELFGVPGDLPNCFEQFNPDNRLLPATLDLFHPMYTAAFTYLIENRTGLPAPGAFSASRRARWGSGWIQQPGFDSPGHDLFKADLTKNMEERVDLLKELCVLHPARYGVKRLLVEWAESNGRRGNGEQRCGGFTSTGWLKHTILPQNERVQVPPEQSTTLYILSEPPPAVPSQPALRELDPPAPAPLVNRAAFPSPEGMAAADLSKEVAKGESGAGEMERLRAALMQAKAEVERARGEIERLQRPAAQLVEHVSHLSALLTNLK